MEPNHLHRLLGKLRRRQEVNHDLRQRTLDGGDATSATQDTHSRPGRGHDQVSRILGQMTSGLEDGVS
jgi:hypothetical protein